MKNIISVLEIKKYLKKKGFSIGKRNKAVIDEVQKYIKKQRFIVFKDRKKNIVVQKKAMQVKVISVLIRYLLILQTMITGFQITRLLLVQARQLRAILKPI